METEPDYGVAILIGLCASLVLALLTVAYLSVARLNRQLLQANAKLADQSLRDGLTGLYNRKFLDEKLAACLSLCQREQLPLTLAMLDLDYFKQLNDMHGHMFGDHCLRQFAVLLQQHFQRPTDFLIRFGGEEFVLISVGVDEAAMAKLIQEFINGVAEHLMTLDQQQSHCSVSVGWLCQIPQQDHQVAQWLAQVDAALYQAKANGRNGAVNARSVDAKMA